MLLPEIQQEPCRQAEDYKVVHYSIDGQPAGPAQSFRSIIQVKIQNSIEGTKGAQANLYKPC